METKQAIRQRLEERLLYLQQRLHQVERARRRETNPLDPDGCRPETDTSLFRA
jgi:hypothetical protein